MKKVFLSLLVTTLSFALGLSTWVYFHHRTTNSVHMLSGPPCPAGIITSVAEGGLPVHVSLLEAVCENQQTAIVRFLVRNVADKSVKYYRGRAIYTYDNYVDDGSEFGSGPLAPGQETTGVIGQGAPVLAGGRAAGQLRSVKILVSQFENNEGTMWRLPFLNEVEHKR